VKQIGLSLALTVGLAACSGGNPFQEETGGDGPGGSAEIPADLAQDLESFSYSPDDQTLTIRGVSLEDGAFEDVYRRRPGLDRGAYEAYTAQDGSLDRHSTAYVRDIRGTRAAAVSTGGQFTFFFSGGAYGNAGDYSAPAAPETPQDGGLVTYAGNYVGMLNRAGSGEDLLPVAPGTPGSFRPTQVVEVTGRVLINASFADGTINGTITEREVVDYNLLASRGDVEDLDLGPGVIAEDGTFTGITSVGTQPRGTYGGIFGGQGATEVAGIVTAEEHIDALQREIEIGVFVLAQCGTPQADPVCDQPVP